MSNADRLDLDPDRLDLVERARARIADGTYDDHAIWRATAMRVELALDDLSDPPSSIRPQS